MHSQFTETAIEVSKATRGQCTSADAAAPRHSKLRPISRYIVRKHFRMKITIYSCHNCLKGYVDGLNHCKKHERMLSLASHPGHGLGSQCTPPVIASCVNFLIYLAPSRRTELTGLAPLGLSPLHVLLPQIQAPSAC